MSQPKRADGTPLLRHYDVLEDMKELLGQVYGELAQPSEALAKDAGTNPRSARNHLAGRNLMRLTDFFNAARQIPEIQVWGLKMLGVEGPNLLMECRLEKLVAEYQRDRGGDAVN